MFETPLLQRIKAFKISIASKFPFIQLTDFKELLLWKNDTSSCFVYNNWAESWDNVLGLISRCLVLTER